MCPACTQAEGDGEGDGAGRYRDAQGKPTSDAPWLLGTTEEIETLRPRSPVRQPTTASGDNGQAAQAGVQPDNLEVDEGDQPDDD